MRAHLISSGHLPAARLACQGQAVEPGSGPVRPCCPALAQLHAAPLQQAFLAPCAWGSGPSDSEEKASGPPHS